MSIFRAARAQCCKHDIPGLLSSRVCLPVRKHVGVSVFFFLNKLLKNEESPQTDSLVASYVLSYALYEKLNNFFFKS